jgi:pimeloyl-ACP methyl ester carboxylesterase
MTTLNTLSNKPATPVESGSPPFNIMGLLRRTGVFVITSVVALLALIVAVPIGLLFVVTSVPILISIGLAVVYIAVVVMITFVLPHTPTTILLALLGLVVISGLAVVLSQGFASTPPITDANGQPIPNSIASLERITLRDSQQWVTIRGNDMNNPVLLFLAGGPGGSELVMTRRYLAELEQHFVVVNWDQPGAGKSYNAVEIATLTPERYVADAYELTQTLRERFHQDKIYVLGESWGSILGVWLVQAHPDLFYAFISTGQMVNTTEDDVMGYEFAINVLTEQGKTEQAETLRRNLAPPYTGDGMALRYIAYITVLDGYMRANAQGEGGNPNLLFDSLAAPEYGLLDKVNWVRGLSDGFTEVYPQIADLDFTTQATQFELPVYFIVGRWDVNAMTSLTEEYFSVIEAPDKQLIWFENSGHTPMVEEPAHFVEVMVNSVLAETLPPTQDE